MIVWKLDELLRLRGVKGRELARKMEIGENYLSRVRHEVPDRLSLSLLDGLCRELDCTIGDLLEYRADKPVAKKRAARKVAPATDEDFGAIVAEALGAALEPEERPAAASLPAAPEPVIAPVVVQAPVVEMPVMAPPVVEQPVSKPAVVEPPVSETPVPEPPVADAGPEAPTGGFRAPETPPPPFEPMVWPPVGTPTKPAPAEPEVPQQRWAAEPVPEGHLDAPAPTPQRWEAEPVPEAHLDAPEEAALPQQRWSEAPVPEGHLDAATPAAPAGSTEAAGVPAAVFKGGALGARLSQLKRQRPS